MSYVKTAILAGAALGIGLGVAGAASAQATIGGHPDFTGVWGTYRQAAAAGAFTATGDQPQLTPMAQKKLEDYQSVTNGTNYSAGAYCVGYGMPASMLGSGGYPMEWFQRPEQINVVYEAHSEMRRIYFGDRVVPTEEVFPERDGYSVGHWEGDHLIVETTDLKEQVDTRYPHSEQAKIVEEYYLGEPLDDGTRVLVAEMTMTDPVYLEEPFHTTKKWQEIPNGRLLTYECTEPQWLDKLEQLYEEAGLKLTED